MTIAPLVRGWLWALAAAVAFGVSTPAISLVRAGTGPWLTAALLYFGAAGFAAVVQGSPRASLATFRRDARTYVALAVVGGTLAPAAFTAGLGRAGPFASSLALNLEVLFSIALAAVLFREQIGRRVAGACVAIVIGGALLAAQDRTAVGSAAGIALVALATALWAADNVLSSTLREADTRVTVFWKSLLGATLATLAGIARHETLPAATRVAALVAIGAGGYGASLWCYLQAQRTFGVARTASVFAIAPFVGAIVALVAFPAWPQPTTFVAIALMALGIALHGTERHAHRHRHRAIKHAHVHRHDDDHHDHDHDHDHDHHDHEVAREHAHVHHHADLVHEHAHAPDPHHTHDHDGDDVTPRSSRCDARDVLCSVGDAGGVHRLPRV
ncbi:MAG: hypothetical protein NVS2B3_16530 [Vulcanimicrobiaceae bacterium]